MLRLSFGPVLTVFSFLDVKAHAWLARTCKNICEISQHPGTWPHSLVLTPSSLYAMPSNCQALNKSKLKALYLHANQNLADENWIADSQYWKASLFARLGCLRQLTITDC